MSTYTTTVTIPVTIEAPDHETAVKLAEIATAAAVSGVGEHIEVTTGEPHLTPFVRICTIDRSKVAANAVRTAVNSALVPFEHTQTAPHWRQVQGIARNRDGVELTRGEIHAALIEAMAE